MRRLIAAAILAATAALSGQTPAAASDVCERKCLEGMVDRYLEALVAQDPNRLPLAVDVRFTENGQELRLGDGLWGTASGPGRYKLYASDPEGGQVGFLGTVFENGTPIYMALRLRVEHGLISEVETILARPGNAPAAFPPAGKTLESRGQPRAEFLRTVPRTERMSREDLVRIADSYFTGLAGNTGRNVAPFARSCERWENGVQTTNNPNLGSSANSGGPNILAMNCEDQQKSGFFPFVTSIRDRRYPVVDRERGLVLAFAFFEHDARMRQIKLTNGQTVPNPVNAPLTFEIAELFQIDKGRIDQIEAVLNTVPYGMQSDVWDEER
jgi:hypothetical protein